MLGHDAESQTQASMREAGCCVCSDSAPHPGRVGAPPGMVEACLEEETLAATKQPVPEMQCALSLGVEQAVPTLVRHQFPSTCVVRRAWASFSSLPLRAPRKHQRRSRGRTAWHPCPWGHWGPCSAPFPSLSLLWSLRLVGEVMALSQTSPPHPATPCV